tara:strand:+ start:1087 stop:1317 length:231 start_codon:yes stop_codon:yes gene_type:complete
MKKSELLEEIKETLQRDEEISLSMKLEDIKEWDSLAIITMISLYDELFGVIVTSETIEDCQTLDDLIKLVEDKIDS